MIKKPGKMKWFWHADGVPVEIVVEENVDRSDSPEGAILHVVDVADHHNAVDILYGQLANRPPYANISHDTMPSKNEHESFVERYVGSRKRSTSDDAYRFWYIIELVIQLNYDTASRTPVGNVYLTRRDEVGLFLLPAYTGRGYGEAILDHLEDLADLNHVPKLYANIAPSNDGSKRFFERRRYSVVQETLALDLKGRDI